MISKEVLSRIELVVFDLDGTLLDDNNSVGKESTALIKQLSGKGVFFSLATGRLLCAVTEFVEALNISIPVITLDGTIIKNPVTDVSIYESFLKPAYVQKAINLADRYFLKVALCHDSAIYYTEENSLVPDLLEKFGAKYQQIAAYDNYLNNTLEVVIVGDDKETVRHVANKMSFPYTFGIQASYYKSHTEGVYALEIRNLSASKGDALKRLCKNLKIKLKNTAVVADWYNDKSLFETDALKIAVANAVPEIKRMADMITRKTNNEDGVAEFLKILLKAKS